jgi:hypothetical protein
MTIKTSIMMRGLTTDDEIAMASDWIDRAAGSELPFSFRCDGKPWGKYWRDGRSELRRARIPLAMRWKR